LGAAPTQAGSYTAVASFPGSTDYGTGRALANFNITKANATIVITAYAATYDGQPHTATGSATGVGGVKLSGELTLSATTHTLAGAYGSDSWTFSGDSNYNAASGTVTDSIAKAGTTTTVTDGGGVYTGSPFPVTAAEAKGVGGLDDTTLSDFTFSYVGTGATTYSPSASAPVSAGTYTVTATYGGDANHAGSSSTPLPFTIAPAGPSINATPGATVVLGTNVPLTASATLAGGVNATGTITFTMYNPSNVSVYTDVVTVTGNGTYSASTGTSTGSSVPTQAGTYQWVATYNGGNGNNKSTSTTKGNTPEIAVGPGATVVGNALYLVGGSGNDQVNVKPVGTSNTGSTGIQVSGKLNGTGLGTLTYNQAFTAISVVGFGGNDNIQLSGALKIATAINEGDGTDQVTVGDGNNTITLGNGNNTVTAGNGNNLITSGNGGGTITVGDGNNVVVAGTGNNTIEAGDGNNLLVGGLGKDALKAGDGSNILIDGSVQLTQNSDTLFQVLSDWITYGASAANVAGIRSRLKVTYNTTASNTLKAGHGLDWFWEIYGQDHTNRKLSDLLN
jgi:hypothetical protein